MKSKIPKKIYNSKRNDLVNDVSAITPKHISKEMIVGLIGIHTSVSEDKIEVVLNHLQKILIESKKQGKAVELQNCILFIR